MKKVRTATYGRADLLPYEFRQSNPSAYTTQSGRRRAPANTPIAKRILQAGRSTKSSRTSPRRKRPRVRKPWSKEPKGQTRYGLQVVRVPALLNHIVLRRSQTSHVLQLLDCRWRASALARWPQR